ncbi:YgfZ/GcvT domain-containing protein, partial [Corynebacterium vitaeruminis]
MNNSSPQSENATTISPEAEEAAYSSPLMCLPGACGIQAESAHPAWRGVAWHYGDPLVEQRFFESGAGLVDRSQRRFIEVTGPEAAAFLNNLLSQKLDDAADGFSAQALDLDVQGHVLHQASVTRKGEAFYLDTTPDRVVSLLEYLRKMIFWSKVEVDYSDLALLSLVGPEREQVAGSVAGDERVVFSRGVERGLARIDLAVRRADLLEVAQALVAAGAHPVGLMGYTAERVKALEPEASIDLDEKSIPHEAPFFIPEAVHLHKGCYRG